MELLGEEEGPLFRPIDRHGNAKGSALSGRSVCEVVKKRAQGAGLSRDPGKRARRWTAHRPFDRAADVAEWPNRRDQRHHRRPVGRKGSEVGWRAAFVAGLLLGAVTYVLATGEAFPVRIEASSPVMVAARLLVGFGARLGSGCTSGHGVSGIARLSRRSIAATLVFVGAAIVTVFVSGQVFWRRSACWE